MNITDFEKVVQRLEDRAEEIVGLKRQDYTQHSKDVLANFKTAAQHAGVTPLQVWLIFFNKHYSAIASHVQKPNAITSEPIIDRFADLRNYLHLGWALLNDVDAIANSQLKCKKQWLAPNQKVCECELPNNHVGPHKLGNQLCSDE